MDILYVVRAFPKLSESFVLNELHELDRRGHDVAVFALERPDEPVVHDELEALDPPVHYGERRTGVGPDLLSPKVLHPRVLSTATPIRQPRLELRWLRLGRQIAAAVEREGGVDLLHAHFARPNRVAVAYAAAYHDVPCTVTAHAYEIFARPDHERIRRTCAPFDHVVAPSEYNRRYLRETVGVDTDVSVVPAATRVEKFEPSDDAVEGRLLTVGRFVEKKGHEYAIDAVAALREAGYDVDYHVVGGGKLESELRARVREQGIEDAVTFLGRVSDERLHRELREATVFVLPCVVAENGDRDVMPVALKEAMATETACVSTTVSAIPELITDGEDGLLVRPNDASAVADAVAALLDDPALRRRLGRNGRETVAAEFDVGDCVDALVDVFRSVRAGRNG